jgi:hypothetical protein
LIEDHDSEGVGNMGLLQPFLFVCGLYFLISGHVRVTKQVEIQGRLPRLLGFLLAMPYLASLSLGAILGMAAPDFVHQHLDALKYGLGGLFWACLLASGIVIYRAWRSAGAKAEVVASDAEVSSDAIGSVLPVHVPTPRTASPARKIVAAVLAVSVWFFGKDAYPRAIATAAIAVAKASGHGWDRARGQLATTYRVELAGWYTGSNLEVSEVTAIAVASCIADKAVDFLNTTACSPVETAEDAELNACLEVSHLDAKVLEFALECRKQHIPNDWRMRRKSIRASILAGLAPDETGTAGTDVLVDCRVEAALATLSASKCPLVNHAASRAEDLLNDSDMCFGEVGFAERLQAGMAKCVPEVPVVAKPQAAIGDNADTVPSAAAP